MLQVEKWSYNLYITLLIIGSGPLCGNFGRFFLAESPNNPKVAELEKEQFFPCVDPREVDPALGARFIALSTLYSGGMFSIYLPHVWIHISILNSPVMSLDPRNLLLIHYLVGGFNPSEKY